MIDSRRSETSKPNPAFVQSERKRSENNKDWLIRQLKAFADEERSYVVLFGGRSAASVSVRMAQACLRSDHTPSWWSHAIVLRGAASRWTGGIWDVPLTLDLVKGFPPVTNGLVNGNISTYADAEVYPNVGIMSVPVRESLIKQSIERFKRDRGSIDAVGLLWTWMGYALGVGQRHSPLHEGIAYPSAAMIQLAYGAAGLDLTPNVSTAAGCPETLWQAGRWWYDFLEWDTESESTTRDRSIRGIFCRDHAITG